MSSSAEIQAVRSIEQRYPCDLINGGHTHERHTVMNPEYRACLRHVRKLQNPTREQIVAIVRLHRLTA